MLAKIAAKEERKRKREEKARRKAERALLPKRERIIRNIEEGRANYRRMCEERAAREARERSERKTK